MDNIEVIKAEVAPVVFDAKNIVVCDSESYQNAGAFLSKLKAAQKKVSDFFAPMKKKAHEAHKAITEQESETLTPLKNAERIINETMIAYKRECERRAMEEQRKAQAIADEAARKERERLEKEAAKLKTPELREQRLEQAASIIPPVIAVASDVPKFDGLTTAKTWKAEVVDVSVLPREWMVPNETALNSFAKATKGAVPVAGVRFVQVESFRNK
jgi:hypothetical protein